LGNYGRIFAEYVHLEDFRNDKLKKYISIEGLEHLNYLKNPKKKLFLFQVILIILNLWLCKLKRLGIELAAIYRPLNNIFLNKTMEKIRTENICKNQIKKVELVVEK
jgi:KDO2-lipid IV(A) lauroyltransferase